MNYAGPGTPEPHAVFCRSSAQEIVYLIVLGQGLFEVGSAFDSGLDQVVAVDRRGNGSGGAPGLHELEHGGLTQNVLQDHAIGPQLYVGLTTHHAGGGRVVQVGHENLLGQSHRPAQVIPDYFEVLVQGLVYLGYNFTSRFYSNQIMALPKF